MSERKLTVPDEEVTVGMWSSPCCLLDTYQIKDEEELQELLEMNRDFLEADGALEYKFFRTPEDALAYYYDDDAGTFMSDELSAALYPAG